MSDLEYGDMLWMRHEKYGETLYMVVNPPIVCEHCCKTIVDWELSEENTFFCPNCKEMIKEFSRKQCSCGDKDIVSLIVATNNNFCYTPDEGVIPYNSMVNRIFAICQKSIIEDVENGKIRLLSKEETIYRKRLLTWTAQDEYEPGKPMPQWIIELFPD